MRFLAVGAAAVGVNIVLFALLVGLIGIPYLWATAVIFVVGNAFGFAANRSWTFSQTDRPFRRLAIYYATMLGSLAANLISMFVLVDGLGVHYLIASAITSLWLAPLLYIAHQLFAFRAEARPEPSTDVTLLTNYFPEHGGGVEIVAGELAGRLESRYAIRWLAAGRTAADGTSTTRIGLHAWNGLEGRFGLPVPIPGPGGLGQIIRSVHESRVVWVHDLIYVANLAAGITALILRRPLIVTVHVGEIPYRSRAVRALMAAVVSIGGTILSRADHVAFVSERVRREFVGRWNLRQATLIPNGVDTSVFRPRTKAERLTTRAVLGIDEEPVALFVGRFVERKGLRLLRQLAHDHPAIKWIFAGDGPMDPESWGLPNVHVVRRCSREVVAQLYGAADVVVLPSVGEGFPLVVQEALATGARVLVDPSTSAGFPGVEAYVASESVVEPGAAERWSSAVTRLLAEVRPAELDDRAAAFARMSWDWDKAAEAYTALFETHLRAAESRAPAQPSQIAG